jgi:hypothetical protein
VTGAAAAKGPGIPEEREVAGVDDADQCRLWYDKTAHFGDRGLSSKHLYRHMGVSEVCSVAKVSGVSRTAGSAIRTVGEGPASREWGDMVNELSMSESSQGYWRDLG